MMNDERLDALLVEFFQAEMPAEFRDAPVTSAPLNRPPAVRRSVPRATAPDATTSRGALGLLAAAAVCLVVLAVVLNGPGSTPVPATNNPAPIAERSPDVRPLPDGPAFELTTDDLFVESVEGRVESLDRERFDTNRGPVELRARRETTNVSVVDPNTGLGVDLETQVLDIEIVPIELDEPLIEFGPDDDAPDDLPMPRDDRPRLPEATGGDS